MKNDNFLNKKFKKLIKKWLNSAEKFEKKSANNCPFVKTRFFFTRGGQLFAEFGYVKKNKLFTTSSSQKFSAERFLRRAFVNKKGDIVYLPLFSVLKSWIIPSEMHPRFPPIFCHCLWYFWMWTGQVTCFSWLKIRIVSSLFLSAMWYFGLSLSKRYSL